MDAKPLFLHALSPLHAGTGQGVGVIDLPIAREKATGIPFVPGSSLKGVLRDACADKDLRERVFGPETGNADEYAGSVQISDLRLLLLPVRSLAGTFAWVTSPLLLRRFVRDVAMCQGLLPPASVPGLVKGRTTCAVADQGCVLLMNSGQPNQVVLEDLMLTAEKLPDVALWAGWLGEHLFKADEYWQTALRGRLCIVHDDVLSFLLETATEVTARIRLEDDKKTVASGALWYEEALPAETVLAGLVVAAEVKAKKDEIFKVIETLTQAPLQVGGKATVGRGLCRIRLA
jgi:CRISPR-associated protein Cmr4